MKTIKAKIKDIRTNPNNPRFIKDDKFNKLVKSIKELPQMLEIRPIVVNDDMIVLGGNMRLKACEKAGLKEVHIIKASDLTPEQQQEFIIKDNVGFGSWDWDILANEWDVEQLDNWGLELPFDVETEEAEEDNIHNKLTDNFLVPPFSILDTRQEYWQDRKREWKSLIGDNGESRESTLMGNSQKGLSDIKDGIGVNYFNSASVLDPVLAELSNLWFGVNKGKTFDCFAGDSVFGYVSDYLGNKFTGIELRQEQTDLNNKRLKGTESKYICDDGQNVLKHIKANTQDLLFSCPPYFDLEVYSKLENDASNQKEYKDFLKILDKAFSDSIKCLKNNRFAVITISNIRNKKGFYYNLVDDVKNIFIKNNMPLYNDIILIEQSGTAAIRASRNMKNRKVCKTHQNILVFYKGDTKEIKNIYPKLDLVIDESQDV